MKAQSLTLSSLTLGLLLAASVAAAEGIAIDDPYARAVPPGQPNSAVFMGITNATGSDRALVSAESGASEVVELHTHTMEEGMMKMRKVDKIDLPAGETVALAPGGLHVMLIGLKDQLAPGGEVAVKLTFDDGTSADITAPVREVQPPMGHKHH